MRFSRWGGFALPLCWTKFVLVLWFLVPSVLNAQAPTVFDGGVVNGASFTAPVVAGSLTALFGENFSSSNVFPELSLPLPTSLGGATVRMDGIPAPLAFVGPGQINFQIPWELAGQTQASLTVTTGAGTSSPFTVNLVAFAPAIFALSGAGTGQGAIANSDFTYSAPSGSVPGGSPRAANPGETIHIFCVGLGAVTNEPASGTGASENPSSETIALPEVTIGSLPAQVIVSRLTPISSPVLIGIGGVGTYRVSAVVPAGAPEGDAVPVTISIGGVSSNTVTMAIALPGVLSGVLNVAPQALSFSAVFGAAPERQALQIGSDAGTVNWTASVELLNGSGWLTVSPASGTATLQQPATASAEVNFAALAAAGLFQAVITVTDTATGFSVAVPVVVVLSAPGARLLIDPPVVVFTTASTATGSLSQTLRVINEGEATLDWSISAVSGNLPAWLTISPSTGTAGAGQASTPTLTANPEGLGSGVNQVLLGVSAPGANNDPQLVTVTLRVVPADTPASADVSPTGCSSSLSRGVFWRRSKS